MRLTGGAALGTGPEFFKSCSPQRLQPGLRPQFDAWTVVVGQMSGSSSLIAHAISLSDLAGDFVALVALKMASSAPDATHPYG